MPLNYDNANPVRANPEKLTLTVEVLMDPGEMVDVQEYKFLERIISVS